MDKKIELANFINPTCVRAIMGRIKTKLIKRLTFQLIKDRKQEFSKDFGQNKEVVGKHLSVSSKRIRNAVAGYVTRRIKQA